MDFEAAPQATIAVPNGFYLSVTPESKESL